MNKTLKALLRLAFLGIGLGVIIGSSLKIIIPINTDIYNIYPHKKRINKKPGLKYFTRIINYKNNSEENNIRKLSAKWIELARTNKDLEVSGFLLLIDEGKFANLNSNTPLPSASSIKIPILIVLLSELDKGKIKWDEPLEITKDIISGGSGWMAYEPLGKSFPLYEAATEMIRVSDNTATNLLIKRIGGINILNQKLKGLGLKNTQLKNLLPDLEGTNLTTTHDLAMSIALVDSGSLLSQRSRDLFREIMSTSKTNSMLPKGIQRGLGIFKEDIDYSLLIKGYAVFNKTGDIGISYADAALIQIPNNTRAVASFIVKGPFNDVRSPELIRKMASEMVPFLKPQNGSNIKN